MKNLLFIISLLSILLLNANIKAEPTIFVYGIYDIQCKNTIIIVDSRYLTDYKVLTWSYFGRDYYELSYKGKLIDKGSYGWLRFPKKNIQNRVCSKINYNETKQK